jgi:hypothetical protein
LSSVFASLSASVFKHPFTSQGYHQLGCVLLFWVFPRAQSAPISGKRFQDPLGKSPCTAVGDCYMASSALAGPWHPACPEKPAQLFWASQQSHQARWARPRQVRNGSCPALPGTGWVAQAHSGRQGEEFPPARPKPGYLGSI